MSTVVEFVRINKGWFEEIMSVITGNRTRDQRWCPIMNVCNVGISCRGYTGQSSGGQLKQSSTIKELMKQHREVLHKQMKVTMDLLKPLANGKLLSMEQVKDILYHEDGSSREPEDRVGSNCRQAYGFSVIYLWLAL